MKGMCINCELTLELVKQTGTYKGKTVGICKKCDNRVAPRNMFDDTIINKLTNRILGL